MRKKLGFPKKWKELLKNSVDEFEVEEPTTKLLLTYWNGDASKCLCFFDKAMRERNINYAIKSCGKTSIFHVGHISKYEIICAEWRKDIVVDLIKKAEWV